MTDKKKIMKYVFHLSSCSTCQRIIKSVKWPTDIVFRNIKEKNLSIKEIEEIRKGIDSYEAIFSKRAMKYKSLGLKDKHLSEDDMKNFILEEYTFLKRPVVVYGDALFIGNSKKTVGQLQEYFGTA